MNRIKILSRLKIKSGFKTKVYCSIISVVLLAGILVAISVGGIVSKALLEEHKNRGISTTSSFAARSVDSILAIDFLRLNNLVNEVKNSFDDITYAFIIDKKGEILAHTFQGGFPVELKNANIIPQQKKCSIKLLDTGAGMIYDFACPVFAGKFPIGGVRIGLVRTKFQKTLNHLLWSIFASLGISLLISIMVGAALSNQISKPVKRLNLAMKEIMKGNLNVCAGPRAHENCWEIKECSEQKCPAHGSLYRRCWYLGYDHPESSTCGQASKENCEGCPVYKKNSGDEIQNLAESFDAMAMALKNNLTKLAESKKILEQSEKKYRRIFETSMDMLFTIDNYGKFQDINNAGLVMIGYDLKNVTASLNLDDLFLKPFQFDQLVKKIEAKGFIKNMECSLKINNGRELAVLLSCTASRDENGRITGYDGIIKDITELHDMEQQLLQADKLASIGQLASGVAHEINNPLALILGYVQFMIRNEAENSKFLDDLKTIEKQTRNCKKIVEALLHFARKSNIQKSIVDINRIISDVLQVTRHHLELDHIKIKTGFARHIPFVKGDAENLKQVFMNLIINAGQSITNNGSIIISTAFTEKNILVKVEDTGSGIEADIINKIFDPFFSTKPTGEGTGLGLSISYGIIKEHNGNITVKSRPGKGSLFRVELPAVSKNEDAIISQFLRCQSRN